MPSHSASDADLDEILARTRDVWDDLAHARLLVTGGTGFFGAWLLESFTWAVDRLGLDARAVVVTRDPETFRGRAPHISEHASIQLLHADVRRLPASLGNFDAVIHAATSANAALNAATPLDMLDTIILGTRRLLEQLQGSGSIPVLLTSSGAVYGRQGSDLMLVPDDWPTGPDPLSPSSTYAEGKRVAELLGALYTETSELQVKVARCFAFVGPHLPLDRHFAIGNFIRDGLNGRRIEIRGDGTTVRSYLYAAELAIWLWTILLRGASGRAYNVGSEDAIDIAALGSLVAESFTPPPEVKILGASSPGAVVDRYVPSTARARAELGLEQCVSLPEAIQRTIAWHRAG